MTFVCNGAGEVGNLRRQFFLFSVEAFELGFFSGFNVFNGTRFDGEHFFEDIGDQDVLIQCVQDGGLELFASDARCGAACATFGARATVGFISSALTA